MKKTFFVETVLIFLIVVSQTVFVKPFNILAESNSFSVGRINGLKNGDNFNVSFNSSGNLIGYSFTSGSDIVFSGRYIRSTASGSGNITYGMPGYFISKNNFSGQNPSNNSMNISNMIVNGTTYYYSQQSTSLTSYQGNYYMPYDLPVFDVINNAGTNLSFSDYLYYAFKEDFNDMKLTHYDPYETFLSWDRGNNPYTISCDYDLYVIAFYSGTSYYVYFFSNNPDAVVSMTRGGKTTSLNMSSETKDLDKTVYYNRYTAWSYNPNNYDYNSWESYNGGEQMAFQIFYNNVILDGSNNETNVNYGQLKVGYSSSFVSSRDDATWRFNKDTITWDSTDTNGNFIGDSNVFVNIRAIPGYYEGPDKAAVLYQNYGNWISGVYLYLTQGVINVGRMQFYDLVSQNAYSGKYETTWGNVVDHLPSGALIRNDTALGQYLDNKYYLMGWRYQINFEVHEKGNIENIIYTSPWQDIFQVTAVDPSTSNQIIETYPDGLSPELYNLLQTVNTLNNTVQNWNVNGVPVNMQPNQQVQPDNSWVEILITSIAEMVGRIIDAIGNIISDIVGFGSDLIEGLFNLINSIGINILDTFTNLWNGFIDTFNNIGFNNDNPDYDIGLPETSDEVIDIIPAFLRGMNRSGLMWMIWIPLVFSIIKIIT